jgi:glyoxylase-like metal-dependent hydrolase (beta-lactamase superfamily II)
MTDPTQLPSNLLRTRHQLGPSTELLILSDGLCHFDGGAMFGVVPKALWNRTVPCDDQNRVTLGLNTLVVRTRTPSGLHTTVIETGFGEKLPPKLAQIYGAQALLPAAFAEAGIPLESVDTVINTHLHWDHCGWNTRYAAGRAGQPGTSIVPTFPNATYYAHAGEIAHARARHERDAISYVPDNYEPLLASGQMQPLTLQPGDHHALTPHLSVELYPGHTHHLMAVHIEDPGNPGDPGDASDRNNKTEQTARNPKRNPKRNHACYISDLIPTAAHLPLTWGLGFDLDPLRTIEEKKRFYARAIPEHWLVLFTHEPNTPAGYLDEAPNGATLRPLPPA